VKVGIYLSLDGPVVIEGVLEVAVVELGRVGGPRAFEPGGKSVDSDPASAISLEYLCGTSAILQIKRCMLCVDESY
jgi:hypothetical protein